MELTTRRLILRPWRDEDAAELYRYARDPRVGPAAGWPPHTSPENSLEIIRGVLSEKETYAVVLRETGKPVGSVGILLGGHGSRSIGEGEAEIGYWIGVPYWGQGLIPEAVRILLDRCFEQLHCKGVWCCYYHGNEKSKRVQEKCGFTYHHTEEKTLPDGGTRTEHYTYQTREQWLAGRDFQPGRYRHFKGKEYQLLFVAKHSETMEDMVVYRALYGEGGIWVRPKAMWNQTVERDGLKIKRFSYIGLVSTAPDEESQS